jgi:hypothetical protein
VDENSASVHGHQWIAHRHNSLWQPLEKVLDFKRGEATRAAVSVLREWWVCLDAKLASSERTGCYLLRLASSSGLMKLN